VHKYAFGLIVAALAFVALPMARAGTTTRVSVASNGTQSNGISYLPSMTADGRYVGFHSGARNLVPGDTNGCWDVFLHDRQAGTTERISIASSGAQANGHSYDPSISADGRYVAFDSAGSTLVPGDTNGVWDVFVRDRQAGTTERISLASSGAQGNGHSYDPSISADGRYVAFDSGASNLVPGDTNGYWDVFVHDRQTHRTTRVSVSSTGKQGKLHSEWPSISADGRYVAFHSSSPNLVWGDTNGDWDVFVRDRQTGQTIRASVTSGGAQASGRSAFVALSANGGHVAFYSLAPNLVAGDANGTWDAFVHELGTGKTKCVTVATDGTPGGGVHWLERPSISADGRYVTFASNATNLVAGDTNGRDDVFVRDCVAKQTTRVSVASDGTQSDGQSLWPWVSGDGRYVAFQSTATNLVASDTNGRADIFVHDRLRLQPDMMIRYPGQSHFRGDNIYNTTGKGQTKTQIVFWTDFDKTAAYQFRVQNDGTVNDRFTIRGPAGGDTWVIRYLDKAVGGTDITGQVTGAGWRSPSLAPGQGRTMRLIVGMKVAAPVGTSQTVIIRATSVADPNRKDVVKSVTTVVALPWPMGGVISSLCTVPTNAGAQIVFTLSSAGQVEARILNIAGRPVKTLCQARDCEAGTNTLLWNAHSDQGLPVPNGTYLVEVVANTAEGAEARAVAPLRVGK
jgi:Tol biopolymer transport system component